MNTETNAKMTAYDEIMSISDSLDEMRKKHVPASGMSQTVNGECLRAFDRVIYRFFNDGDKCTVVEPPKRSGWDDEDYEDDCECYYSMYGDGYSTVRPSVLWMIDKAPTVEIRDAAGHLTDKDRFSDEEYEAVLLPLAKAMRTINWSNDNPNTCDSRDYDR